MLLENSHLGGHFAKKKWLNKQFRINDYNKVGFIFDINRLLVAKYASMDWDNDGVIDGIDSFNVEITGDMRPEKYFLGQDSYAIPPPKKKIILK